MRTSSGQGLNLRPTDYKSVALPTELPEQTISLTIPLLYHFYIFFATVYFTNSVPYIKLFFGKTDIQ